MWPHAKNLHIGSEHVALFAIDLDQNAEIQHSAHGPIVL